MKSRIIYERGCTDRTRSDHPRIRGSSRSYAMAFNTGRWYLFDDSLEKRSLPGKEDTISKYYVVGIRTRIATMKRIKNSTLVHPICVCSMVRLAKSSGRTNGRTSKEWPPSVSLSFCKPAGFAYRMVAW